MISLLKQIFVTNWQRKLISLILAMILWMVVNRSMTITKTVPNIPVRVLNLPPEKTIEGMQVNGLLNQRVALTLTGNKSVLDEVSSKDLEVSIDARDKPNEWIATIGKKNLVNLNSELDISKGISKVSSQEMIIKQSRLVSEKIPVLITHPIGEPPKGYQLLDVWPYQLTLNIKGPEETVKKLKNRGLKLAFNLGDISRSELDTLQASQKNPQGDEISFFVPNSWKKIAIPALSETPFELDDPQAKSLRINFSRQDLLPIGTSIPVTIFYPPKYSQTLNPDTYVLGTNAFIAKKNGIKTITSPLYAQGVSRLFLETVKDMIQVVIIASPKSERGNLLWSAQILYPQELENRYVAKILSKSSDEAQDVLPHMREDYLRNRFRSYMNRFRLYTPKGEKLSLKIELEANTISVTPQNLP